jgi:hypothetical protein
VDIEGFEPSTFRMQNGRSTTELNAPSCSITELKASHAKGEVAEWSKALRSGRSLFGGVGSNPTLTTFCHPNSVFPLHATVV